MFWRSRSRRMVVRVSDSSFELLVWLWYFTSPKAIELRLLMCSIVSWA